MNPETLDGAAREVAIIGMAGRFPGASSIEQFWRNLIEGRECVRRFQKEELLQAGTPIEDLQNPAYVPARAVLDSPDLFDADFFGFTPREAEMTDPQHRVFLECAWEALEDAAANRGDENVLVAVFAGCSLNTYFLRHVLSDWRSAEAFTRVFQVNGYQLLIGNDKDYLATRVAYKLGLRGPAMTVQTGCSTSLVAVCQAVACLNAFQCDLALAGGVSISFPQERGYIHQPGAIASADGHCRAFDAQSSGTVFGAGCGVVALKRLDEALADGDHIYAVIKGAAVNNDGSSKVSYMAPSVRGQAEVIMMAHASAGITADSISYVEAHGTGTPLGDPIEISALTQAFRASTGKSKFCGLGSVKGNVGHLEAAAGVAGLIKTALALHHKQIPPTLFFSTSNPNIDFDGSPFFVESKLREWTDGGRPRRAGVSSFGIGGTNAHVVLEEAPAHASPAPARLTQLFLLSARTEKSLSGAAEKLATHLSDQPGINLADAAYTLQCGRLAFRHRLAVWGRSSEEIVSKLRSRDPLQAPQGEFRGTRPKIAFVFPGQGAQYPQMGRGLYETEPVFRDNLDECAAILLPQLGLDIRRAIYPDEAAEVDSAELLKQTRITQPAIFVVEYALARLWQSWGIRPDVVLGHSVGEYACAVLAGVFRLEDALALLATRARLMERVPNGSMLAVRIGIEVIGPSLPPEIAVAAINSPQVTTLSGPTRSLETLKERLEQRGISCQFLATSHAFHSAMMAPIMDEVATKAASLRAEAPVVPWISTCTGAWMEREGAPEPHYWARQLREPVLFSKAVRTAFDHGVTVFLETGPGHALSQLVRQHAFEQNVVALSSLGQQGRSRADEDVIAGSLGQLWLAGFEADWKAYHQGAKRLRISLPTYSFDRKSYWIPEPAERKLTVISDAPSTGIQPEQVSRETTRSNWSRNGESSGAVDVYHLIGQQLNVIARQIELVKTRATALGDGKDRGGA